MGGAYSAGGNSTISTISEEGNERKGELHEGRKKTLPQPTWVFFISVIIIIIMVMKLCSDLPLC